MYFFSGDFCVCPHKTRERGPGEKSSGFFMNQTNREKTLGAWLCAARAQLEAAASPDPAADARILALDGLNLAPEQLPIRRLSPLASEDRDRLDALLRRRLAGEPVQYAVGRAWFMGLPFFVDRRVLIPRMDTETLAEAALAKIGGLPAPRVRDVCTGSGAIGLSIGKLLPRARVTLCDLSTDALAVARENARRLEVPAEILSGDLLQPVGGRTFDLIVCNPPYIRRGELAALQREVRKEPVLALDGGPDGLEFYRRLAKDAPKCLAPGGWLLFEVGAGQAREAAALFSATEILNDLNGVERVVCVRSV